MLINQELVENFLDNFLLYKEGITVKLCPISLPADIVLYFRSYICRKSMKCNATLLFILYKTCKTFRNINITTTEITKLQKDDP